MIDIKESDVYLIEGGLSISGTLINSLTGGIRIILELGRSLGSALRRGSNGKMCSVS